MVPCASRGYPIFLDLGVGVFRDVDADGRRFAWTTFLVLFDSAVEGGAE